MLTAPESRMSKRVCIATPHGRLLGSCAGTRKHAGRTQRLYPRTALAGRGRRTGALRLRLGRTPTEPGERESGGTGRCVGPHRAHPASGQRRPPRPGLTCPDLKWKVQEAATFASCPRATHRCQRSAWQPRSARAYEPQFPPDSPDNPCRRNGFHRLRGNAGRRSHRLGATARRSFSSPAIPGDNALRIADIAPSGRKLPEGLTIATRDSRTCASDRAIPGGR
jgi:hypothetical protein